MSLLTVACCLLPDAYSFERLERLKRSATVECLERAAVLTALVDRRHLVPEKGFLTRPGGIFDRQDHF